MEQNQDESWLFIVHVFLYLNFRGAFYLIALLISKVSTGVKGEEVLDLYCSFGPFLAFDNHDAVVHGLVGDAHERVPDAIQLVAYANSCFSLYEIVGGSFFGSVVGFNAVDEEHQPGTMSPHSLVALHSFAIVLISAHSELIVMFDVVMVLCESAGHFALLFIFHRI